MKVALDTNVLAYAEGLNGEAMRKVTLELLEKLPQGSALLPIQALAELFYLLVRKARRPPARAHSAILSWGDAFPLIETSPEVLFAAAHLATNHRLSIWDSIVLSSAAEAGCRLLLSEDLQDGFTWESVTVTNPFSAERHSLLEGLLGSQQR